ncbi:MAG: hypothetical protein NVSMB64_17100 [Candidatus Velthaea sp.]
MSSIAGGSIPAHSDYVRITYATQDGETPASPEAVNSLGTNALTIVRSPRARPGTTGYIVYAVMNNGGSGTRHTRQNDRPIAFGTDYTEPVSGWTTDGAYLPTVSNVSPVGGYFDASIPNGPLGALVLPNNSARAGTTVSIKASVGRAVGATDLQSDPDRGAGARHVLETIVFSFSDDVNLNGFPSFKLRLPAGADEAAAHIIELYDGRRNIRIATMPGFAYEKRTFFGDTTTEFRALRNHSYYAELVEGSSSVGTFAFSHEPKTLRLPSVNGIDAVANVPPATFTSASSMTIVTSSAPPVGLPAFGTRGIQTPLYFASLTVSGTPSFTGDATVTFSIPETLMASGRRFALAGYDAGFASRGWVMSLKPSSVVGNTLIFTVSLPEFLAWRQYGFALFVQNASSDMNRSTAPMPHGITSKPVVAVLGDSESLLTILPPSGAGCIPGWGPVPECQYSIDPMFNWPGVLARLTDYDVRNFAALGTQTVVDSYAGPSMVRLMVPQIPADAQIVVCQCGVNDLALNAGSPSTSARAAQLTKAIVERAPHARIIYLGIRCYTGCSQPGVDAWNDAMQNLAKTYGAFVDLAALGPAGASDAFPDGTHPSPPTALKIAGAIAATAAQLTRTKTAEHATLTR